MIEIIKRVEPVKNRLLLECICGSVIVFDESDIECPDIQQRYWRFSCPVCKKMYWAATKNYLVTNYFIPATERQAK